jgi:transposase
MPDGWIEDRHRSWEFLSFINHLLQAYPEGEIHVILDNVITHRSKEVQAWHAKARHRRVVFHFLPTYSSWLNLIEVLFSLVEANVLRRGVFPTKEDLVAKILAYINRFNTESRPFRWTKTADEVLRSLSKLTRH